MITHHDTNVSIVVPYDVFGKMRTPALLESFALTRKARALNIEETWYVRKDER